MGNMGYAGAARTMTQSLDKKWSLDRKRRCNTMPWSYLIMGTCAPSRPPSRPLLGAPPQPRFFLQRVVEDDVSGGGNALLGAVCRGQGRQLGERAIQSTIVGDAIVGGGGRHGGARRAGVRRTMKHANYKRWGWDRSSDMQMLFEGDPARPGHPLRVEIENKLGDYVLRIRCRLCRSLISYHDSSWACATTHIQSHNIATTQDIAAAAVLAS